MNKNLNKVFDLEERTMLFSKNVIQLCKLISLNYVTQPLINQLIRCATSIGANYFEANGASSKKDFKNKIYFCKKEAKETQYWLRLIAHTEIDHKENCLVLWKEAHELTLIFSKIALNTH